MDDAREGVRKDNYFQSPIGRYRGGDRRDSYPQSPFKLIKSPGFFFDRRQPEEQYGGDEDDYPNIATNLRNFFEKDDGYTVGQMFCSNDYPPVVQKKETVQEMIPANSREE